MQATLPVRTYSPGWFAGLALALAVGILVAAAVVFSITRPATPAVDTVSQQAADQALIQHRAGERESLLNNSNVVDQALIDHRAGERESLFGTTNTTPVSSERDEGLGSSINAPSNPVQVWSGNPGRAEAGSAAGSNGNPGMKPR